MTDAGDSDNSSLDDDDDIDSDDERFKTDNMEEVSWTVSWGKDHLLNSIIPYQGSR